MRFLILFFLIAPLSLLHGDVRRVNEQNTAEDIAVSLGVYRRHLSNEPVTSWAQISKVSPGLIGLNVNFPSGSVTEFFSFVPLDQRDRFPLGNLILVQSKPMPWPDEWKTEDHENPGQYLEHKSHQDIRFLIYEKDGKFIAERWYETKFQTMLAETGLTVPPPTPYYPPPPTPPGEKPAAMSSPAVPVIAAETAPAVAPATIPTPTPAPVAPPPAKSPNRLWWITGALAVLVAFGLVMACQKNRR
jgi:hypothetical protein